MLYPTAPNVETGFFWMLLLTMLACLSFQFVKPVFGLFFGSLSTVLGGTIKNTHIWGLPGGSMVKNLPANAGDRVRLLIWEDPTCSGATNPKHHNS